MKRYPENKPLNDTVCLVFNEITRSLEIAIYHSHEYDYFIKYDCSLRIDFPLDVTHYLEVQFPEREKSK